MSDDKQTKNLASYIVAESLINQGEFSIFNLNLEQLIFEKMILLFEKMQPAQNDLKSAVIELSTTKNNLFMEIDFKKELSESRPTVAMKEAYIEPQIAEYKDKVDTAQEKVDFYKNKLNIINDLIKHKRLLLQVEGGLKE